MGDTDEMDRVVLKITHVKNEPNLNKKPDLIQIINKIKGISFLS